MYVIRKVAGVRLKGRSRRRKMDNEYCDGCPYYKDWDGLVYFPKHISRTCIDCVSILELTCVPLCGGERGGMSSCVDEGVKDE